MTRPKQEGRPEGAALENKLELMTSSGGLAAAESKQASSREETEGHGAWLRNELQRETREARE